MGCFDWWLGKGTLSGATAASAGVEATIVMERNGMEVVAETVIFK